MYVSMLTLSRDWFKKKKGATILLEISTLYAPIVKQKTKK